MQGKFSPLLEESYVITQYKDDSYNTFSNPQENNIIYSDGLSHITLQDSQNLPKG